ncbi:MAG TPA: DUF1800 domain-containing protein [Candidatus Binataceae bacterium]|nr:DUF1800 domain-containing protein [Candidatus Binataceae bacterium]
MIESGNLAPAQRPPHLLNRLAFGPRPGDIENLERIGVERWVSQQLDPGSIPEPQVLERQVASLGTLHMTPAELFVQYQLPVQRLPKGDREDHQAARQLSRVIALQAVQARIVRAIEGPRQLQEVMTNFWFNHFNVFAGKGLCHLWIGAFEQHAIRPHTMGRFRDLLGATAMHPAMLFYLDNWQNSAPNAPGARGKFDGINENYARELMELHTLGVNGGYSQADVIALAHLLTGWGLVRPGVARAAGWRGPGAPLFAPRSFARLAFGGWRRNNAMQRPGADESTSPEGFYFDPRRHDFSAQTFLGHRIACGGIEQGEAALDLLARSPATANHLSYQLAQYFVADQPPPALVKRMALRYLDSDGNIRALLATLFASDEFWDRRYCGAKFKTPYEFVISAVRAAGVPVLNDRPLAGTMAQLGMPLYGCQTPDGYKHTQEAWLNPDAMMTRLAFATALGAGRLPLEHPLNEFAQEGHGMERAGAMRPAAMEIPPAGSAARPTPPDPVALAMTLGDCLSSRTIAAVEAAPPPLRAPLILGSPEFMMR